jgi:FlaA1/EpsC-like NDP-sugar epimerase
MGYEPEKDIQIVFTGLRPGEKLCEELITDGEGILATKHEKIMVLRGSDVARKEMELILEQLKDKALEIDAEGIKEIIRKIIPEYEPDFRSQDIAGREYELMNELRN